MKRAYFNVKENQFVISDGPVLFATHSTIQVPMTLFTAASNLAKSSPEVVLSIENGKAALHIDVGIPFTNSQMVVTDEILNKDPNSPVITSFIYDGEPIKFQFQSFKLFSLFRNDGNIIAAFVMKDTRILFIRGSSVDLEQSWEKILPPICSIFPYMNLKFHIDHEKILFESSYDTSKLLKITHHIPTNKVTIQKLEA